MKQYTLLCVCCLISWVTYSQEFKFYLNGSIIEDSAYVETYQKGDLMRVVFSGKNMPYQFRIATVIVTLTPKGAVGNDVIGKPTSFLLDNTSNEYSNYPSFTFDMMDRLVLLKHNDFDVTIKVHQLVADKEEGTDWAHNNVSFKSITLFKRDKVIASHKR